MTALERIKEIEDVFCQEGRPMAITGTSDIKFLLKAFRVMREIAIEADRERIIAQLGSKEAPFCPDEPMDGIEAEFERRMSK